MKIEDVKRNLNKMVVYKGKSGVYRFSGCMLRKDINEYYYQAELQDTKSGNSISFCKLEDITEE